MTGIGQIIDAIDGSIGAQLAATLAGLALVAAAFSPATQTAIEEKKAALTYLQERIEKAERTGQRIPDTPSKRDAERLNLSIALMVDINRSLVRAFVMLIWLLAYSVTIDPIVGPDVDLVRNLPIADLVFAIDDAISLVLLGWAVILLLKGARGIGEAFGVSLKKELAQIRRDDES